MQSKTFDYKDERGLIKIFYRGGYPVGMKVYKAFETITGIHVPAGTGMYLGAHRLQGPKGKLP